MYHTLTDALESFFPLNISYEQLLGQLPDGQLNRIVTYNYYCLLFPLIVSFSETHGHL